MIKTTTLAAVLFLAMAFVAGITTNLVNAQEGNLIGESKSWKITVVSAEYGLPYEEIPWDKPKRFAPLGENQCFLFLKLSFEYRGPSGDVAGPRVTLMNDKNETFSNSGNLNFSATDTFNWQMLDWIMSATHPDPKDLKTMSLKTGDTCGAPWIEFLIVLPTGSKDLRLSFGGEEIPGIAVTPTKLK